MEIEEVKKKVKEIVKQELDGTAHTAFFFGSRIDGTASPRSDLDVGIEGSEALSAEIMRSIKSRCDALRTLYTIDIVDFSSASEDFKSVAKVHTEKIM